MEAAMASPAPARRVLLIEDHPDGRASMRMVLEDWGYAVEVAEDGPRGVEKALAWRPDTAIVDIALPRMDGYRVAQQVRAALREEVLLIALTGYHMPADREKALACGFDVFLIKPADLNELAGLLRRSSAS
jgi:CheY-like chemotaxis protein